MKYPNFPIEVFPESVQNIILHNHQFRGFPINYQASSALVSAAAAAGKRIALRKFGYTNKPQLWMALVGKPGVNKSTPLRWFLGPLTRKDSIEYEELRKESDPEKQFFFHPRVVKDSTIEALQVVLQNRKEGVIYYTDELKTWLQGMGQYKSNNDERATWNSLADGADSITVNRVSRGTVSVSEPVVSVAGTIQPGVLCEQFKNSAVDGFLFRLLWSYPESESIIIPSGEPDEGFAEIWAQIIERIQSLLPHYQDSHIEPNAVYMDEGADKMFEEWFRENAKRNEQANKNNDFVIASYYAKGIAIVSRLAITLHVLRHAAEKTNMIQELQSVDLENAIKLYEGYFKDCYELTQKNINDEEAPVPFDQSAVHQVVGDNPVTRKQVIDICEKNCLELSQRTIDRAIGNPQLFEKVKRGLYQRK